MQGAAGSPRRPGSLWRQPAHHPRARPAEARTQTSTAASKAATPAPQRPEGRRPVCIQSLFILCRSLRAVMDTSWFFSPNSSRWAKRGMYRHGSAADTWAQCYCVLGREQASPHRASRNVHAPDPDSAREQHSTPSPHRGGPSPSFRRTGSPGPPAPRLGPLTHVPPTAASRGRTLGPCGHPSCLCRCTRHTVLLCLAGRGL